MIMTIETGGHVGIEAYAAEKFFQRLYELRENLASAATRNWCRIGNNVLQCSSRLPGQHHDHQPVSSQTISARVTYGTRRPGRQSITVIESTRQIYSYYSIMISYASHIITALDQVAQLCDTGDDGCTLTSLHRPEGQLQRRPRRCTQMCRFETSLQSRKMQLLQCTCRA